MLQVELPICEPPPEGRLMVDHRFCEPVPIGILFASVMLECVPRMFICGGLAGGGPERPAPKTEILFGGGRSCDEGVDLAWADAFGFRGPDGGGCRPDMVDTRFSGCYRCGDEWESLLDTFLWLEVLSQESITSGLGQIIDCFNQEPARRVERSDQANSGRA